jgi:hypothetical protein
LPCKNLVPSRRSQRGYLLEIPLILLALVLALVLIMPRLPVMGQKVLLGVGTVPTLMGLYYLIVLPGWTPGTVLRGRAAWRMALFLGCAAAIVAAVCAFMLR